MANQWILDTAITGMQNSKYFKKSQSESMARSIIDILFCDRLDHLEDSNAKAHLNWLPEMPLKAVSLGTGTAIAGRADWVLAHNPKSALDSTLVVL
jgi:hypothetical protein